MNLRNYVLCLGLLCCAAGAFAAEGDNYSRLKGEISQSSPRQLSGDMIKTDFNGDTLSVVMINSPLEGLSFVGNIFGEPQVNDGPYGGYRYTLYITEGTKKLDIRSEAYHQETIIFPTAMGRGELWTVNVEGIEAPEVETAHINEADYTYSVTIDADDFIDLYIDEELITPSTKRWHRLEEGTHYISSRFKGFERGKKINVKNNELVVDAMLGGSVVVKNGSDVSIDAVGGSPEAHYLPGESHGNTEVYDHVLGNYVLSAKPNSISLRHVTKDFEITPRDKKVFRIDEMVPYFFLMYHATLQQPFGANLAGCKNFGWFASFSCDSKSKIETPYGETEFVDPEKSGSERNTNCITSWTLSTGPMVRLIRKLYLQAGVGLARYLRTSEPKVLTADYCYKNGLSVNAELMYRYKALMVGVGYMRQFVKSAYNPDIESQFTASIGLTVGL